jgi:hypothetical protein
MSRVFDERADITVDRPMDRQVSDSPGNKDYIVLYTHALMTMAGNISHNVLNHEILVCGRSRVKYVRSAEGRHQPNECGEMLSFRPARRSRVVISSIMTLHHTVFPDRDISASQHENNQIVWPLSVMLRSSP